MLKDISKLADELVNNIDNVHKVNPENEVSRVKKASTRKSELAESLKKCASELRSVNSLNQDISYADIENYINRFNHG